MGSRAALALRCRMIVPSELKKLFSTAMNTRMAPIPTTFRKNTIVTAALNGVLTDPKKFNVPVTPEEMALEASRAYNAGASIVHIHFRDQTANQGHLPSWDPVTARNIVEAIRTKVPSVLINMTTGTVGNEGPHGGGPEGPTAGPIMCMTMTKPEIAAINSGSLNYLKTTSMNTWAWPPILFDNPVEKISKMLLAMKELNVIPECECFDTGILRSLKMYREVGLLTSPYTISLCMGVASGMPANPKWLRLLVEELPEDAIWQTIAIGKNRWDLHRESIRLGGNVRTGLEDTFYRSSGERATNNGELIDDLVTILREEGKEPATPSETRMYLRI